MNNNLYVLLRFLPNFIIRDLKRDQLLFLTGARIEPGQHRDQDSTKIRPGQDQDQGRDGIGIEGGLTWK
jgi:hypothetical protein